MENLIFKKELRRKLVTSLSRYELPNGVYLQDITFDNEEIFEDLIDYLIENILECIDFNSFVFSDELINGIKSKSCDSCKIPYGIWIPQNHRLEELENVNLIRAGRKILPL